MDEDEDTVGGVCVATNVKCIIEAINMISNREEIIDEFKKCYGYNARFKDGQLEAIEAVLNLNRILVVQKTGWGKSLVYFLATKMLRKYQEKFTLIISPLLVLMNNQIDSAAKLGLNVPV